MKVKSPSRVRLFATPWTVAYEAPPSMEFSWQEYWSGLPFPSPGDIPNPGIEPKSPTLQADSLPAEPQGKPQNTGVSSQSLLQGIFPTQGSNSGLLYCRRILYQLSSQGSLRKCFPKPQPQNHLESFSQGRFPGPTLRVSDLGDLQGALGVSML